MKKLILTAVVGICATAPAAAQHGTASQANCHGLWTATLASGIPRGDLSPCWPVLQQDIVAAIIGMKTSSDTRYIFTVVSGASGFRTPAVFNAALSVVTDHHATHPARMGSFAILISQYRRNASPKGAYDTLEEFLTKDVTFSCQWEGSYLSHEVEEPLPGEYLQQIKQAANSILQEPGEDAALRGYARCVVLLLDAVAPVKVPASAIAVRYRCGSIFVVTNASDHPVEVRYEVGDDDDEANTIDVPSHGERLLPTGTVGRVRVFVGNDLAGTAENGGTPCT